MESRHTLMVAAAITLLLHAAMGGGLYAAGELIDRGDMKPQVIEIEVVEPPPPEPKPKPPPPPPPPVEEVQEEPRPEPDPPPRRVVKEQPREKTPPPPTTDPVDPPPESTPAPGPVTNNDTPAPVIRLPDIAPGGSGPPVARGRPTTRKVGTGGDGTNTGGGGPPDSTGTGGPRPVSIAAIKSPAKPLNPDLDTSGLYPDAALQAGVEGSIKLRLVVDENGKVTDRRLLTRLGYGLDEVAMKLALKLRFKPAEDTTGKAVPSVVPWTFHFVLPD